MRNGAWWIIVGALCGVFFYLGWHHGATRLPITDERVLFDSDFVFALPLTVLWLLILPFVQGRLTTGGWRVPYGSLFAHAWRNKLALAEAALFTALFWLLLELWQSLFGMLKIEFFRELFEEPIFVYPVTAIVFGIALHLIGSIDRLTSVVLEQLLNVLKWLAIVAGSLLTLFTIALSFKLPGLIVSGEHSIGAAWLLWLLAVIVLLLNAAFRDGSVARPYPAWIAATLRFTVPLTVMVSATAIYALVVRTQQYGMTVERVWAYIVAGTVLLYSLGYSVAAFSRGPWMGGMARVNVAVAIVLIVVIAVSLTPVLSPQRLAANSQFRLLLNQPLPSAKERAKWGWGNPFSYLRFETGVYGLARLKELAAVTNRPQAEDIRRLATAGLAMEHRYHPFEEPRPPEFRSNLTKMTVYPAGRRSIQRSWTRSRVGGANRPGYWGPHYAIRTTVARVFSLTSTGTGSKNSCCCRHPSHGPSSSVMASGCRSEMSRPSEQAHRGGTFATR